MAGGQKLNRISNTRGASSQRNDAVSFALSWTSSAGTRQINKANPAARISAAPAKATRPDRPRRRRNRLGKCAAELVIPPSSRSVAAVGIRFRPDNTISINSGGAEASRA